MNHEVRIDAIAASRRVGHKEKKILESFCVSTVKPRISHKLQAFDGAEGQRCGGGRGESTFILPCSPAPLLPCTGVERCGEKSGKRVLSFFALFASFAVRF
ncbi:hypothetical protein BCD64_01565 [Nostoc sp. MBR 210]|nr:hypothetical protein BCD64_01565 [Nostoc sp. MBR 210]